MKDCLFYRFFFSLLNLEDSKFLYEILEALKSECLISIPTGKIPKWAIDYLEIG